MSAFDIKTIDNRLDRKRKEIIIENLLDVALKQIEAAAKIGLKEIDVTYCKLQSLFADKSIGGNLSEGLECYERFIKILVNDDNDFDVITPEIFRLVNNDYEINISWRNADGFGTTASKMFRLSEDEYSVEYLNIFYEIERELLRNIQKNGRAKAIIPYALFGYEDFFPGEDVKTKILNYHSNESQVKKNYVYKYIEEYERLFKISTTEDGVMIMYVG